MVRVEIAVMLAGRKTVVGARDTLGHVGPEQFPPKDDSRNDTLPENPSILVIMSVGATVVPWMTVTELTLNVASNLGHGHTNKLTDVKCVRLPFVAVTSML